MNKLPNSIICGNLIFASNLDFRYNLKVIQFMKDNQIRPNVNLLKKLETAVYYTKNKILEAVSVTLH